MIDAPSAPPAAPRSRRSGSQGWHWRLRRACARLPAGALVATLFTALLGGALLGLAAPRLIAAFCLLPGDPGMALLDSGRLPSPAAYERMFASRRAAAHWLAAPATLIDLGITSLSLAQASVGRRAILLDQAERQLRAGLAGAPANAHAWTWLAFIHTATGDHERAARALDLALRTGPYEPQLALPRSALGLTNWPWLDHRTATELGMEFAHALRMEPDRFIADVLDSGRATEVRAALTVAPAGRRAFDHQLEEVGRSPPAEGAAP
jgi:hypothetical protein